MTEPGESASAMSSESTLLPATEATACLTVPLKLARMFECSVSCQKSRFSMSIPKTTEGLCGTSNSYLRGAVSEAPGAGTMGSGSPGKVMLPALSAAPPVAAAGGCRTTASGSPGRAWLLGCRMTPGSGWSPPAAWPRELAPWEAMAMRWKTSSTTSAATPAPPTARAPPRRCTGERSASSSASLTLASSVLSPNPHSAVISFSKSSMSLSESASVCAARETIDCSNCFAKYRTLGKACSSCSGPTSTLRDME
mmetsp:Transcript_95877/g.240305  ORF Transcript_95877/g.240305 Transcript_95877/m.240305 type:complete len:253 (-) Transcript_95877:48-806(-)